MTCSLLFWLNCSGGQWKDWTFQRGLVSFSSGNKQAKQAPSPFQMSFRNTLKSTVSRKTTVRKKCGGKDVCQWGRAVAEGCVLWLGSCPLGGAEAEGCVTDTWQWAGQLRGVEGGGAQSFGDGIPGKVLTDWPPKTFLSLPTYVQRLFTTPPAYCSTA